MARLPTVSGDTGTWGTVLNDYLTQNVNDSYTLASQATAGATQIVLDKDSAGILAGGSWIAVGATTTKCEVRRVTAVSSATLTLNTALVYTHAAGEFAWVLQGTLIPPEWFGCKSNDSTFDSSTGLQQAFTDMAIAGGNYGLTGHRARYYTSTPLCIGDNIRLDAITFTAKSPMSIDLSLGLDYTGDPDQYHFLLCGQIGTVTSVDTGANTVTLDGNAGSIDLKDRLIFYPAIGSTLPGGIEAGRQYFMKSNPSGTTYTVAVDYDGTALDITSAGSGTIYWYSIGMARMLWDFVTFEGASIPHLNGLYAALQQPSAGRNIRLDGYPGAQGATYFWGQQGEFYNFMATDSTIGLNCGGMQFLHVFGGNLESCGIGARFRGIWASNRDVQLHGIHWESISGAGVDAGNGTLGLGIYGGTPAGEPFFDASGDELISYSIQNLNSVANTGTAIDDDVRGITLLWNDGVQDGVGAQINSFSAGAPHGSTVHKQWWLAGNYGGQHIVLESYTGELRLNGGLDLRFGDTGPLFTTYAGSPESNVTAPPGSLCMDSTNGVLYVKKTGTGNTGWKLVTQAA